VTGEPKDKTEPWVEAQNMRYAFGYLSKAAMGEFMQSLGMRGYPSAALVDPQGTVVWAGHPASLSSSTVEKHLRGADRTPVNIRAVTRTWPESAKKAADALRKGKLADALVEASALDIDPNTVRSDVESFIADAATAIKSLHAKGDLLGFEEAMKASGKDLAGLEQSVELEELLKEMRRDGDSKAIISAQRKLLKYGEKIAEQRKSKELDKLEEAIDKIAGKHPGTFVETQAEKLRSAIAQRRESPDVR
jgi:hypothetical protein